MDERQNRQRLETEAIIVGYVMSRLDARYLTARRMRTWKRAFSEAADALGVPSTSLKNLRDEFDPFHDNPRRGWHQRPLRSNRQRVLAELMDLSEDALTALIDRILARDQEATEEALDTLVRPPKVVHNVAERLLTGRLAEDFFLSHVEGIIGVAVEDLIDLRNAACGYDFGIRDRPEAALEIKGIKKSRGDILMTDREWREAKSRRADYWLIVIGSLASEPRPTIFKDPFTVIDARCQYQTSVSVVWRARIATM